MKKYLISLLFLISTSASAYTSYGAGAKSCGVYIYDKENRESVVHLFYINWLLGYVSAFGASGVKLKKSDSSAMTLFVENYCRQNPLDDYDDAAYELVEELRI